MRSCIKSDIIQSLKKADIITRNGLSEEKLYKYPEIKTTLHKEFAEFNVSLNDVAKSELSLSKMEKIRTLQNVLESQKEDTEIKLINHEEKESVNFVVPLKTFCQKTLQKIMDPQNNVWRRNYLLQNIPKQTIVVDFSSPNLAKPFHMGHLRSTILGNFICNLQEYLGHKVVRLNYIGDWGTQYGFLGVGYNTLGSEDKLRANPIQHLSEVYAKANSLAEKDPSILDKAKEFFAKMEKGDAVILKQWEQFRKLSYMDMEKMYKRLGIIFHEYNSESMYSQKALEVIDTCYKNGILLNENDAKVIEIELNKTLCRIPLQKRDGSTLYLSRDIAAAIDRKERFNFDAMYYVVDNSQTNHFQSLQAILKKMQKAWYKNIYHIRFGRIHKFSSRKGTAVLLEDFLNEAKERMLKDMKNSPNTKITTEWDKIADILGTSAVLVNDMKVRRESDYEFNWNRMLSIKSNPGVQLQYTHARLCSLFRNFENLQNFHSDDVIHLGEEEAIKLIHCLSRFDDVVAQAYLSLEPCIIVQYLLQLRHFINSALKQLQVKDQEKPIAQARLTLFHCARTILNEGLKVLGVVPLSQM